MSSAKITPSPLEHPQNQPIFTKHGLGQGSLRLGPRDHEYSQSGLRLKTSGTGLWWSSQAAGRRNTGEILEHLRQAEAFAYPPVFGAGSQARLGKKGNNPAGKRLGGCHSEDGPKHGTPFSAGQTLPRATGDLQDRDSVGFAWVRLLPERLAPRNSTD
jgi:hypothetical protein